LQLPMVLPTLNLSTRVGGLRKWSCRDSLTKHWGDLMCKIIIPAGYQTTTEYWNKQVGRPLAVGKLAEFSKTSGHFFDALTPGRYVPVIANSKTGFVRTSMTFGYDDGNLYNTRIEFDRIRKNHEWRNDFVHRRCVIPVNGFKESHILFGYENRPFFIGGIHSQSVSGETGCLMVSILTQPSRGVVKIHHGREPVIIDADRVGWWLQNLKIPRRPIDHERIRVVG